MIHQRRLAATQVCANAPWIVLKEDVESLQTANAQVNGPPTLDLNQLTFEIQ
jgi:hypothetical protein